MGKIMIFRTDVKTAQKKGYTNQKSIQKRDELKISNEDAYFNHIHLTEEDWKWFDDFMNRFGKQ